MKVYLNNLGTNTLSLDIVIDDDRVIRESLAPNGSYDAGDIATVDELNRNQQIRDLVAAGRISVTTMSEDDDVASLLDSHVMEFVQATAGNQAAVLIGTAPFAGVLQVEAQVGAIPGSGESMVFDVLVNGSSVLASALTADENTSPAARTQLAGDVGGVSVAKGDEVAISLTYTAGTATPIINSAVRVAVLKAS